MTDVTMFRLYLMRAFYLLFAIGLGVGIWPAMMHHATPRDLMHGEVKGRGSSQAFGRVPVARLVRATR